MSDYIDTREGWRRMLAWETADGRDMLQYEPNGDPEKAELWVREAPVPALPTAPYTVIRVTPPAAYAAGIPMLYVHDGTRYAMVSLNSWLTLENAEDAADFGVEVLSEPRAVIAEAVIDRVSEMWTGDERIWDVAREFGVEL